MGIVCYRKRILPKGIPIISLHRKSPLGNLKLTCAKKSNHYQACYITSEHVRMRKMMDARALLHGPMDVTRPSDFL